MLAIKRGEPPVELTKNVRELLPEQRVYENLSSETRTALKESLLIPFAIVVTARSSRPTLSIIAILTRR